MSGKIVEIDGMRCVVGEKPALGYTVEDLVNRLLQYAPETPVGMNVGVGSNLQILSLYKSGDGVVWFDLGEAERST